MHVFPQLKEKVEVFYNPINIENIRELSKEKVDNIICSYPNILIAIGRLDSNKNFELLLEVQKELCNENINTHLVILGMGVQEKLLRRKVKTLGIQDSVSFLGFKENPYPYIKNAKLLCLSSFYFMCLR